MHCRWLRAVLAAALLCGARAGAAPAEGPAEGRAQGPFAPGQAAPGLATPGPAGVAAPPPASAEPPDRFPRAAAAYLVALDGRELWGREAASPRPPASLTKIAAALVALDGPWDPAAVATVSRRAAQATGTRAGLRAGERVPAGELLAAALVASANDACLALAEHLAGSEAAFVARMNARARALGLTATTFVNACGHDAPGHRASARDLLALTRAALAHGELRRLVGLERTTVRVEGGRTLTLGTTNALLGRLDGARGVKTGYTAAAGPCVVALVERGGAELLVVLLDATDRWWSAAGLVEKAFAEAGRGG